jgi:hypothetical protein
MRRPPLSTPVSSSIVAIILSSIRGTCDQYWEVGLWNVIERFAMSIVGFLRDRQADILVGNEALPS